VRMPDGPPRALRTDHEQPFGAVRVYTVKTVDTLAGKIIALLPPPARTFRKTRKSFFPTLHSRPVWLDTNRWMSASYGTRRPLAQGLHTGAREVPYADEQTSH
jgi:hypothetical protein